MRTAAIILMLLLPIAGGCKPLGLGGDAAVGGLSPAEQWLTPPVAVQPQPIYLEPGEPEVVAPGTPIILEPTQIVTPGIAPGVYAPGAVAGVPPGTVPGPSMFEVLPQGSGAISPAFGLPEGPVVENRLPNPLVVPVTNNELAWDQLADVVSNYFPIAREQPVQQIEGMLTEGFIETPFQTGSTVLEPQRNDSVGAFNRWQSTLQTIRRKAVLNVQPVAGGYSVRVNVIKQLEDLPQPEQALAGAAVLRNDNSLPSSRTTGFESIPESPGWIDLGRDEPLEQELLRRIRDRLANPNTPSATQPVF